MHWEPFLGRRRVRRLRSVARADELRRGAPLVEADLPGWACAADPALRARLDEVLRVARPRPAPRWVRAALADEAALRPPPVEEADVAERIHRRRLRVADGPEDPFAWLLDELAFLGEQVERIERGAWREERAPGPAAILPDRRAAELWRGWFEGRWVDEDTWNRAFFPDVRKVFRAVMAKIRVPVEARARVIDDLSDGFYFQMVGATGAVPGWLEVASRIVEAGEPEPIRALASTFPPEGRTKAARCATRRGAWADTTARLFPDRVEPDARAHALDAWWTADLRRLEATVDLHVIERLVALWNEAGSGDPRGNWTIVTQNRGRARGRLRAVWMLDDRARLADVVLATPGLARRTAAALRRYAWAWAWQQVETHFERLGAAVQVTPPCAPAPPAPPDFDADARAAAASWVLLVVLRGQLGPLRRWVRTGSAQEGDTTLYRLLAERLPRPLADLPDPKGKNTYHRLRTWLVDALPGVLEEHVGLLADLAGETVDRDLRARVTARLRPVWHPAVALPASGFPTLVGHAADVLASVTELDPDAGDGAAEVTHAAEALAWIGRADAEEER